jgi:hypothetical protein
MKSMNTQNGYVYIFKNPEYPGRYKIGKTQDHPEVRANQLSRQTSSVGKFEVFWSQKTSTADLSEKFLHVLFAENHYDKEFFDLSEYDEDFLLDLLKDFKELNLIFAKLSAKLESQRIERLKDKLL